jgi:hypothetical protein
MAQFSALACALFHIHEKNVAVPDRQTTTPEAKLQQTKRRVQPGLAHEARKAVFRSSAFPSSFSPHEDTARERYCNSRLSSCRSAHEGFALRAKVSPVLHLDLRALRRERYQSVVEKPGRTRRDY